jgi:RNA recognition motif-containing protein
MPKSLFIKNLAPTVTEDQLKAIFGEVGDVEAIQRPTDRETGEPRGFAFVHMVKAKDGEIAIERYNGHEIAGQVLEVLEAKKAKKKKVDPDFKLSTEVADELEETVKRARIQIWRIVQECGADFVNELITETRKIIADGGLDTLDGQRKRTKGGIFLRLAKEKMDAETRAKIFPNWRELKQREKERKAAKRVEEEAKQAKRNDSAAKKDHLASSNGSSKPKAPPTPEQLAQLDEAKDHLVELRQTEKAVEQRLADIKSGKIKGGMMSALKEVADIKGQIAILLKKYPPLA